MARCINLEAQRTTVYQRPSSVMSDIDFHSTDNSPGIWSDSNSKVLVNSVSLNHTQRSHTAVCVTANPVHELMFGLCVLLYLIQQHP